MITPSPTVLPAGTTAGAGVAEWDLLTDTVHWSPETYLLLGRDPRLGPLTLDRLPARLPARDRATLRRMMTDALVHGRTPSGTVQVRHPDGGLRAVRCVSGPVLDQDGRVIALRMLLSAG
ncbi:PAS domain-containing protein [Kitasatospora sp. NPDC050543]|uniref:PAS domain-containing protein n=1 Tax=Kitasatospora sp. NPDC050543 TaxID=3364054 RepID=UPI00379E00C4